MAKSRIGTALKAFANPSKYDENNERKFMTILSNLGFGAKKMEDCMNEGFMANTYVYSIINRIAETGADIPIIIEQKIGDKIEPVIDGDFFDFVHRPNPQNNYKSLCYESLVYQLSTGNVFQYGLKPTGFNHFSERSNLAPQYIVPKVKYEITGPIATSYRYQIGGKDFPLEVEEIMHLKKFNPNPNSEMPTMGLSPLQSAYRTLVASNEIITADASLIKNRGAIGMLSSKGERPLTPEEKDKTERAVRGRIGGSDKFGSVGVTSGEFDFIKFAMSPADLKILESGVMKLRDLCSVYGAKSRMFNDPNGSTFNNMKEDMKSFYINAVLPPLENQIDHFNKFFVDGWNLRDNTTYIVRLDTSSIEALQEDQAKLMLKSKVRNEIIRNILTGISEKKWDRESAIVQLMDALVVEEEYAETLIGEEIVPTEPIPETVISIDDEQN